MQLSLFLTFRKKEKDVQMTSIAIFMLAALIKKATHCLFYTDFLAIEALVCLLSPVFQFQIKDSRFKSEYFRRKRYLSSHYTFGVIYLHAVLGRDTKITGAKKERTFCELYQIKKYYVCTKFLVSIF